MTLKTETVTPELYSALEDIVGSDHINKDPAVLDGYCFGFGTDKYTTRPLAAVIPGSTEEVQAIVKVCNRHKVKVKAHSTGFSLNNTNPVVSIDLRRMDRIIKIDEKNMIAIVEPYCTAASIIYAAMKKGLRVYHIGGGPSSSTLANCTSTWGYGTVNVSAGFGGRVPLATEWVLPDGELLKMGSLGAVNEWFSGDGPGPSLRGVMRGIIGHMGGLGVFTRVAVKLVPYYGPPKLESYGEPPSYKVKIPDTFRVYTIGFPSKDNVYEAMRLLQEEGIVFWCSRRGPFTQAAAATASNKELAEIWETEEFKKKLEMYAYNVTIGMNASSPREMDYKEKAVHQLMENLDGWIIPETENELTARFLHGFMSLGAVKGTFRSTGGMGSAPFAEETGDSLNLLQGKVIELKDKYGEKGLLLPDGDSTWVTLLEDFAFHMETPVRYDPVNEASKEAVIEYSEKAQQLLLEHNIDLPGAGVGLPMGKSKVPEKTLDFLSWINKIRKALDPNSVGDLAMGVSSRSRKKAKQ